MGDAYEKNRAFGKPENIEKRLAMWIAQLSHDKSFPWVGLGLIDDLKCACRMLGGDPDARYVAKLAPKPAPKAEYDL